MHDEDVIQENSKILRQRKQKQTFQWTNPKQQRQNIKMLTKKKLQLTKDMQHKFFSVKANQVEEARTRI